MNKHMSMYKYFWFCAIAFALRVTATHAQIVPLVGQNSPKIAFGPAVLLTGNGINYKGGPVMVNPSPAPGAEAAATDSVRAFRFQNRVYSIGYKFPAGKTTISTSESYEWVTNGETVDHWTTLITTHKLSPLSTSKPLSAEVYAQNVAALNQEKGAAMLETSIINTPDAKAAGIDTENPPYLLVYIFLNQTAGQPSEFAIQKIQKTPNGGLYAMIYAQKLQINKNADLKTFLASPSYDKERRAVLLCNFPY